MEDMPVSLRDLTICDRIDLAYSEISQMEFKKSKMVWLRKPGTNFKADEGNGYAILTIADILDPIRRTHGKYGVKLQLGVPLCDPEHFPDEGITKNGPMVHFVGHIHYKLVGKDVRDVLEGDVSCEAQDNADKLRNKLVTNGLRTLYRTLYGIDGDDSQDPEEINTPAKPETNGKKAVSEDRFFGKAPKEEEQTKKEKQTEEPIPPADVPVTETTLERPREVKEDTINKACKDLKLRKVVMSFAKDKGYGYNTETWTEEQINEVYSAVVTAGRS